jgi:glycosyltransferase involved in cell wall biosynthesis
MLWDKGVSEFVEASRLLKSQGRDIEFWLVGNSDVGNPTSIDEVILREWTDSGLVKWLGHVADMREVYRSVDAVVLPSYREGLPTSLTEAAACGLPLIASNVPGCVDVVVPGVNGYLVPVKNAVELASAIANLSDDRTLCIRYGLASREIALARFDKGLIFEQRLQIYHDLVPQF